MKTMLSLVLLVLVFVGCSRIQKVEVESVLELEASEVVLESIDTTSDKIESLQYSFARWNNIRDSSGSSYQYTRQNISAWGGQKSETIIVVHDDFVKNRYYHELNGNEVISSWREEGFDALNHHDGGAPVKRMDELYEDCRDILLTQSDVTLGFDGNGILSTCTYGKKGITVQNVFFILR